MIGIRIGLCAALLAFAGSGQGPAPKSFNRFTPMHVGVDTAGVGGVFRIDAPDVVASIRFTASSSEDIAAIWMFYRTVGAPGPFELTVYLADLADPTLPDLSAILWQGTFLPQTPGLDPTWERLSLSSVPCSAPAGSILHVVMAPMAAANFGTRNYVELTTLRARTAMPYAPASIDAPQPVSVRDDALAFMYARGALSPRDACEQRQSESAFQPIFATESVSGAINGQPDDTHLEFSIFGSNGYGQTLRFPGPIDLDYVAMFVRGAGLVSQAGTPTDDLYLDIIEVDLNTEVRSMIVPHLLLAHSTDKLFKSRSHWWGQFLEQPVTLSGGPDKEYWMLLSSPGSSGVGVNAWIYSAEASSLAGLVPGPLPSFGMDGSRAIRATLPIDLTPSADLATSPVVDIAASADAAFRLGLFGEDQQCSVGILDEVHANSVAPDGTPNPDFPLTVPAGSNVHFGVVARNIGIATDAGGRLFARLIDSTSGALVAGPIQYPFLAPNSEIERGMHFTMPANDVHLWLEVGHYDSIGGTNAPIVDDTTPWEIRVE